MATPLPPVAPLPPQPVITCGMHGTTIRQITSRVMTVTISVITSPISRNATAQPPMI